MKKYFVQIDCDCFKDFEFEAENELEAIAKARSDWVCPGGPFECTVAKVEEITP